MALSITYQASSKLPNFLTSSCLIGDEGIDAGRAMIQRGVNFQELVSIIFNGDSRLSGYTWGEYYETIVYAIRKHIQTLFPNKTLGSGFNPLYNEIDGSASNDKLYCYFSGGIRTTWTKYNWLDSLGRRSFSCTNTVVEPLVVVFDPANNTSSTPLTPFGAARYVEVFTTGSSRDGLGVKTGGGGKFDWAIYQGNSVDTPVTGYIALGTAPASGDATDRIASGSVDTHSGIADGFGAVFTGTRSGVLNPSNPCDPTKKWILVIYPNITNAYGGSFILEGVKSYCDELTFSGGVLTRKGGVTVDDVSRTGGTLRCLQGWYPIGTLIPLGGEWQALDPAGWIKPFASDGCLQNPATRVVPGFDGALWMDNYDVNDFLNTDGTTMNLSDWLIRERAAVYELQRFNCIRWKIRTDAGRGAGIVGYIHAADGTTKGSLKEWEAVPVTVMNEKPQNKAMCAIIDVRNAKGGGSFTATATAQGDGSVDNIHAAKTSRDKTAGIIIGALDAKMQDRTKPPRLKFEIGVPAYPLGLTPVVWLDASRQDTLFTDTGGTQVPLVNEMSVTYKCWKSAGPGTRNFTEATNAPTFARVGNRPALKFTSQKLAWANGSVFFDFNLGWTVYYCVTMRSVSGVDFIVLNSNNGVNEIKLQLNGSFACFGASSNGSTNVQAGLNVASPTSPSAPSGITFVARFRFDPVTKTLSYQRGRIGEGLPSQVTAGSWTKPVVVFPYTAGSIGWNGITLFGTGGGDNEVHEILPLDFCPSDALDEQYMEYFRKKWNAV